jgi:hypothetical protein
MPTIASSALGVRHPWLPESLDYLGSTGDKEPASEPRSIANGGLKPPKPVRLTLRLGTNVKVAIDNLVGER